MGLHQALTTVVPQLDEYFAVKMKTSHMTKKHTFVNLISSFRTLDLGLQASDTQLAIIIISFYQQSDNFWQNNHIHGLVMLSQLCCLNPNLDSIQGMRRTPYLSRL